MKLKHLQVLFIFIVSGSIAMAGNENFPYGARQGGVSNASVTYSDVWAVSYNQAGLAFLKAPSAGIYYDNMYFTGNMSQKAVAIALPTSKLGSFGLSVGYFGYSLYNEQKLGVAYAKPFGKKFAFGVQLDMLSTHIGDNYGTKSNFAAEAGLQYEVVKNLKLGAHIYNINRAVLSGYNNERIPTIMRFGLSYIFSEKVLISAETEKDIEFSPIFRSGIEYHIVKPLYLRIGIASNPTKNSFGFGLELKKLKIDFAFSRHNELGYTSMASIIYDLK